MPWSGGWLSGEELSGFNVDDADLGELNVPVGGDGFEDEAELTVVGGLEGSGADGLGIDVGLMGADEGEGEGFDVRGHLLVVAEDDLNGDRGDGLGTGVLDVTVDEGGLAAGEAGGLAHGDLGEGKVGGVGCEGLDGVGRGGGLATAREEQKANGDQDDETSDDPCGDGGSGGRGLVGREECRGRGLRLEVLRVAGGVAHEGNFIPQDGRERGPEAVRQDGVGEKPARYPERKW